MKPPSFLITAGPTREHIDPVRFLSNPSTGKMGYAIAQAVLESGYEAMMISGPTSLTISDKVPMKSVTSADQMCNAVLDNVGRFSVLIMSAAVCDYRPIDRFDQKIKKGDSNLTLSFERTKDILLEVDKIGYDGIRVGFAAETQNIEKYALDKLRNKKLNVIVANDVTKKGAGFAGDTNIVSIFSDKGIRVDLPLMPKQEIAHHLIKFIVKYAETDNN